MELGIFLMPSHPPERGTLYDKIQWDLQVTQWADELGFGEAWFGEHLTNPWEPVSAPDLLIAQAALQTEQIRLATGAHILAHTNPIMLAHRMMQLDHMLQGRLIVGVGAGGTPSDTKMFGMDPSGNEHREKLHEGLEIMTKIWEGKPFKLEGKFWTVDYDAGPDHHLRPYQSPHPRVGVAGGLSTPSSSLMLAGASGAIPLTFALATHLQAKAWESVETGADSQGKTANRQDWRIVRDILVADTDEEARALALSGPIREFHEKYYFGLIETYKAIHVFKHDSNIADEEITFDYLVDNFWVVGSPETVTRKLAEIYDGVGGFGHILMSGYDYSQDPQTGRRSMELMATEVMPQLNSMYAAEKSLR